MTSVPPRILTVCTANICRSPSMELVARHLTTPGDIEVSSAGTHGFVDHAIDDTLAAALPEGIAQAGFRSRRLSTEMLQQADLVLTAETAHRAFILQEHPSMFRKVFSLGQLAAAVAKSPGDLDPQALLDHVATQRGPDDADLDVADPYRRGPEAATAAVNQIEALLRAVLPRLVASGRITG